MLNKFAKNMETDLSHTRTAAEEIKMRKCMKQELKRHSYLTMSKNVSTCD